MSLSDDPRFDPQLPLSAEPEETAPPLGVDTLAARASDSVATESVPIATLPENPAWSGWDVLLIVGLALATILLSQAAILVFAHFLVDRHATLNDLAQRPILLLISQFVIDGAVVLYLFLLVEGKHQVRFWPAIQWNWPQGAWKLLALGAAMLFALSMLENILPMPKETPFEKLFERPRDAYLLAIIATTLGPLVEELFFRGFFYPVLAKRWGAGWGVLLTALPFALMHMPQYGYAWGVLVVIFMVGAVCGIVRALTRSVGASFLVHVGYNGTQMVIALWFTRGFTHIPKALVMACSR